MIPRILVLPGTLGAAAPSARLAGEATRTLALADIALTSASLADYPMPFRDEMLEGEAPQNARLLAQRVSLQDGLVLVCPEIHGGPPAALKNAIDWIASVEGAGERPGRAFRRLVVALASANDGPEDGRMALGQIRAVLASLGADVITAECRIAHAGSAFDPKGRLADPSARGALDDLLDQLLDHTRALGRQP